MPRHRLTHAVAAAALALGFAAAAPPAARAQTAMGELEGRAAPVALRRCVAGARAGLLCKENAECPGSTCVDRNVFNIGVAIHFMATPAELTTIQNMISTASATLFDVTDGQAQIGSATIHNNAFGTDADVRIYPATSPTWWQATAGGWQAGGSVHVSIDNVNAAGAPGESLAHELVHLLFDARDEYEERPAGCGPVSGGATCPHTTTIAGGQTSCLMDSGGIGFEGQFSELCWGHGDPSNLLDVSGGNHDANDRTEQSSCRSNRSCWDQVAWSYPNTIKKPSGAPDPAANGAAANPVNFVVTDETARVVLVLDESGSMMLESPSRMSRLKVAAKDFVALAETGTELGVVSFSDDAEGASGRVNVAIAPLGADRSAWNNAIDGMGPTNMTNIGSGLQKARDLITAAGGVTGNTFVVLMTDGLNNQPPPSSAAAADLQAKIDALQADGVPVFVTCTGSDLGLDSQCAEIAAGTNGWYVDSANGGQLPRSFVELKELVARRQPITSQEGTLKKQPTRQVYVEKLSDSATFTLVWDNPASTARLWAVAPSGAAFVSSPMPQGAFVRVKAPEEGVWNFRIESSGPDTPSHFRAFSKNQHQSLGVGLRHDVVKPGAPLTVYAMPRSLGGAISDTGSAILARVILPDGSTDTIKLLDVGRAGTGGADDVDDDGVFTGVFTDTKLKGAYTFVIDFDAEGWPQSGDIPKAKKDFSLKSPRLVRQVQIAAAVADPGDVEKTPEDDVGTCPEGCGRKTKCERGKFDWRPACGATCPNGTAPVKGLCLVPLGAQGEANCVNVDPANCPPGTPKGFDCTVYNDEARRASGELCKGPDGRPLCETGMCAPRTLKGLRGQAPGAAARDVIAAARPEQVHVPTIGWLLSVVVGGAALVVGRERKR